MRMQTTKWFEILRKGIIFIPAIFYFKIEENEGKLVHFI